MNDILDNEIDDNNPYNDTVCIKINTELINLLADKGINVNTKNKVGNNILFSLIDRLNNELIKDLLDNNSSIKINPFVSTKLVKNLNNETPLLYTIKKFIYHINYPKMGETISKRLSFFYYQYNVMFKEKIIDDAQFKLNMPQNYKIILPLTLYLYQKLIPENLENDLDDELELYMQIIFR